MNARLRLVSGRIGADRALRELARDRPGAVVVFAGTVRPDPTPVGRVVALDYEVDRGPALARLRELLREARDRFAVESTLAWHRYGRVKVGEVAVVVGAAGGHRREAFRAARFLIEEIKRTVPIWKEVRARPGGRARRSPRRRAARRRRGIRRSDRSPV